jgi:hypothetical protein
MTGAERPASHDKKILPQGGLRLVRKCDALYESESQERSRYVVALKL